MVYELHNIKLVGVNSFYWLINNQVNMFVVFFDCLLKLNYNYTSYNKQVF